MHSVPNLQEELSCLAQGHRLVAGIDEAGRGSWAGPLVAAAVILPLEQKDLLLTLREVRDSKLLAPRKRRRLYGWIAEVALGVGVGVVSARWVDRLGLVRATRRAMGQAVEHLPQRPHFLLIDAFPIPQLDIPQQGIIRGDGRCLSIAAASIVAKVYRDSLMVAYSKQYPNYGFAQHKGYGTPGHREALYRFGPAPIHRFSYKPLAPWRGDGT